MYASTYVFLFQLLLIFFIIIIVSLFPDWLVWIEYGLSGSSRLLTHLYGFFGKPWRDTFRKFCLEAGPIMLRALCVLRSIFSRIPVYILLSKEDKLKMESLGDIHIKTPVTFELLSKFAWHTNIYKSIYSFPYTHTTRAYMCQNICRVQNHSSEWVLLIFEMCLYI